MHDWHHQLLICFPNAIWRSHGKISAAAVVLYLWLTNWLTDWLPTRNKGLSSSQEPTAGLQPNFTEHLSHPHTHTHTHTHYISILSSHLRLGLPNDPFPSGFQTNFICVSHLPNVCRTSCPYHRPPRFNGRNVWWNFETDSRDNSKPRNHNMVNLMSCCCGLWNGLERQ